MKVYLGGSLKTPWRQEVVAALPSVMFFDPTTLKGSMEEIARAEIIWVEKADVVMFYMRPGQRGRCSAFEMGVAHALGKTILYIDKEPDQWLSTFAAYTARTVSEGIAFLQGLVDGCNICFIHDNLDQCSRCSYRSCPKHRSHVCDYVVQMEAREIASGNIFKGFM